MKLRKPKYHTFDGKKYRLKWRKPRGAIGLCAPPNRPLAERVITISPHGSSEEIVNTIIHESLHANLWVLDEFIVHQTADDITALLVKCGVIEGAHDRPVQ